MTSTITIHHTPAALPSPTRHHLHLPTPTRRPHFLSVPPLTSSPSRAATTTRRNYTFVPTVIEQTPRGERGMDIFSRLLKERIICINGGVDDGMTHKVVAELTFLEFEDSKTPIVMYINSPGGSVTAGIGIYDTMQYIRPPITTICVGLAASMGSILLVAGTKGKRASLPHATIMIHQPLYGYQGQAKDMSIHTQHLIRVWDTLNNIYVKHTGQPFEVIQKETDRDNFMTPEEAKAFGIIDEVINKRPDSPVINAVKDKVLSESTEKVSNMEEVSSQPARVSF